MAFEFELPNPNTAPAAASMRLTLIPMGLPQLEFNADETNRLPACSDLLC